MVVSGELHWILNRTRVSIIVLLAKYRSGDNIEKNEMGGACSTHGGEERRLQGFGEET